MCIAWEKFSSSSDNDDREDFDDVLDDAISDDKSSDKLSKEKFAYHVDGCFLIASQSHIWWSPPQWGQLSLPNLSTYHLPVSFSLSLKV